MKEPDDSDAEVPQYYIDLECPLTDGSQRSLEKEVLTTRTGKLSTVDLLNIEFDLLKNQIKQPEAKVKSLTRMTFCYSEVTAFADLLLHVTGLNKAVFAAVHDLCVKYTSSYY